MLELPVVSVKEKKFWGRWAARAAAGASVLWAAAGLPAQPGPVQPKGQEAVALPSEASPNWWTQAQKQLQDSEYQASKAESGALQAPNRAQNLRSWFDESGALTVPRDAGSPEAAPWQWGLSLQRYGWQGGEMLAVAPAAPMAEKNTVTYQRSPLLREWYVNEAAGLKSWFEIKSAPPGSGSSLRLELAVRGNTVATMGTGDKAQTVEFRTESGASVIQYSGLKAWDATGRELTCTLSISGDKTVVLNVNAAGSQFPVTIDPLASNPAWIGEGNQIEAYYGVSVASAGDVNGDGYSDVIVGAPQYDNGQENEGRAYVYFGAASGLATTPPWTAESNKEFAEFGQSVASAGDVNGDGYSDIIIGAPYDSNAQVGEGRAYVYLGSVSGLATNAAWILESKQAIGRFGSSVASAGDVNGDGYSDVIVGAGVNADAGSVGRVYVYLGSASGLNRNWAWSAESDYGFGLCVASAGDVNGDGYFDVVVGSSGAAYVYMGSAVGLATSASWEVTESGTIGPPQNGVSYFGMSVATAGDVNGDGYSDVIVGALFYDNDQTNEGRAFVYLGSHTGLTTSSAWTAESDQGNGFLGAVASAGDVNGDGYSDVIVGATGYDNGERNEGRVFAYLGSASGLATTPAWTSESNQVDAYFGNSVASAGDVNGDGYSDVIIGNSGYDNGMSNEGRAFLYFGLPDPGLTVSGAAAVIPHRDTTPAKRDLTNFGPVAINGQSDQAPVRTFQINNSRTVPVQINSVSVSNGSFGVVSPGAFPVVVQPGTSALLRIRAIPQNPGRTTATVTLTSTDPDRPTYTFAVQAEGASVANSTPEKVDDFTRTAGWLELGIPDSSLPILGNPVGLGSRGYDPVNTALLMTVTTNTQSRVIGFREDPETDLPYSSIGPDKVARATFGIYSVPAPGSTPSQDPNALSTIPNFRLRLMQYFVINSMLEVNHNSGNTDPGIRPVAREFAPSTDPTKPSIYHVDLDPVEIPYLLGSAGATVGVQRGFETVGFVNALAPDYQYVQGTIAVTDSSVGTYPIPDRGQTPAKVYGSTRLDFSNSSVLFTKFELDRDPLFSGVISGLDNPFPSVSMYPLWDSILVATLGTPPTKVAVGAVDFLDGNAHDVDHPEARLRVDPERLYKVSFRISSVGGATSTPQIRLRARTAKFQWAQVLELGGEAAVNSVEGRTIAAQALVSVNGQNQDRDLYGYGYHVWFSSPLSSRIRPDIPGTMFDKFPLLMAQPGMGDPSPQSARDLKVGFDVIDSLSVGQGWEHEAAFNILLNRIEIRDYPQVDINQP